MHKLVGLSLKDLIERFNSSIDKEDFIKKLYEFLNIQKFNRVWARYKLLHGIEITLVQFIDLVFTTQEVVREFLDMLSMLNKKTPVVSRGPTVSE